MTTTRHGAPRGASPSHPGGPDWNGVERAASALIDACLAFRSACSADDPAGRELHLIRKVGKETEDLLAFCRAQAD